MNPFKVFWHMLFGKPIVVKELPPKNDEEASAPVRSNFNLVFSACLLEEAELHIKREKEFLESERMNVAIKKAMKYILSQAQPMISSNDIGIDESLMSIFCEIFIPLCKDNNIKATMNSKYLVIDKDSFNSVIDLRIKNERERSIDDKMRDMLHVGVYR